MCLEYWSLRYNILKEREHSCEDILLYESLNELLVFLLTTEQILKYGKNIKNHMKLLLSHIGHKSVDLDPEVLDHIVLNHEFLNLFSLIHAYGHVFQFTKLFPFHFIR